MFGLSFETTPAIEAAHPARADIALFVGWTTRRAGAKLPRAVADFYGYPLPGRALYLTLEWHR